MFKFEKNNTSTSMLLFKYLSIIVLRGHFKHAEVPQVIQRTNTENNGTMMLLKRLRN